MKNSLIKKVNWSQWLNRLLWLTLILLLTSRIPGWWQNYQFEGQRSQLLGVLNMDGDSVDMPSDTSKPSILIFWATWCGPCTLELSRFAKAVKEGELPAERIHAVSVGEPLAVVQKEAKKRKYPFTVYADPRSLSTQVYPISATPTVVFLKPKLEVDSVSSGVSPLGIIKAKSFLKN